MISLRETLNTVQSGHTTCESVVLDSIERIKNNDRYNAFVEIYEDDSIHRANEIDRRIQSQTSGSLAGCVIAVKSNLCVADKKTTCASKILGNYISPYSAAVIERLEAADAVIIGRTNMDEFAMGSSNENSVYGPVRNPVDPERVTGGSSGGSAAAVAADLVPTALGTDTGGSIRQPAAFCGFVGLKPTYSRVSRYGLVAFASSLDQIGPIGRSVEDAAEILNVIAGYDHRDATSVNTPVPDYTALLNESRPNIKIAVPSDFFGEGLDSEINNTVTGIINNLSQDNFSVENVSLPHSPYAIAAYYILANAEASSNLARYDGARYGFRQDSAENLRDLYCESRSKGFGNEVKRRIILGTYVLSAGYYDAYYRKAQKVRTLIYQDFKNVFDRYDVIITPTTPTPAFKIGEKIDDPLEMYLNDIYTVPVNLAGLPALVIPCGTTSSGLPIGLQIIGRHFEEEILLQTGYYIEKRYCN